MTSINTNETEQTNKHIAVETFILEEACKRLFENVMNIYTRCYPTVLSN